MDRPTEAIETLRTYARRRGNDDDQAIVAYIEQLEATNRRLREALEVYADETVWRASEGEPGYLEYNGSFGGYDVARQALAATEEH